MNKHRNPAETVELGARVMYFLMEEEAVIEATKHYWTCNGDGEMPDESCGFCFYGPVDDMMEYLEGQGFLLRDNEENLGSPWFF